MSYSVPHRKELALNLADLDSADDSAPEGLLIGKVTPHRESESYIIRETGREAPWCCV